MRDKKSVKGSKLPDKLYVHNDDGDIFAAVDTTDLDDGVIVGIYKLVEVRQLVIQRDLVTPTKGGKDASSNYRR